MGITEFYDFDRRKWIKVIHETGDKMQATFRIENPDKLEATMRICMTFKEWKELKEQLKDEFPSWKLSDAISDLIDQGERVFYTNNDS